MTKELENWVYSHYGHEVFTPGLERVRKVVDPLIKHLTKKIVIIAGTNGKGETTHRLGKYFSNSSFCSWTSPHIHSINERFSSESGDISAHELKSTIEQCHETVTQNGFKLSYYEFLFFVFCTWAAKKQPEYLFLEVGLGGKLDAVNVFDADLVLITSISRDHQEFLGTRYDLILNEKLGVLRKGSHLIHFLDLKYLRERAQNYALTHNCSFLDLNDCLPLPSFAFSIRNQFLAYAAYCHLKGSYLDPQKWQPSLEGLNSRGEILRNKNEWWIFGSHNVDGMRKLIQLLHSANYNFKDRAFDIVLASFSKRNEKDIRAMLRMLKRSNLGEVIITTFNHPKAFPGKELEKLAFEEGLKFVEDVSGPIQGWKNQKILVAGSYYLLGELRPLFSH